MIILKYVQGRDISYCDNLLKTIQDKQCVECKKTIAVSIKIVN